MAASLEKIALPAGSSAAEQSQEPSGRPIEPLPAARLYRRADLAGLSFKTTAELQPVDGLFGQKRALNAINFGTRIDKPGFNLFVIGAHGARMQEAIEPVLLQEARNRPSASDWIYVHNFENADQPIAIELPAGRARAFATAVHQLIDDLKTALPAMFQSEDYQTRKSAIDEAFQKKQGEAFAALRDKAAAKSIVIVRTPLGFALAPAEVVPVSGTEWRLG